jgi:hypothetical protein
MASLSIDLPKESAVCLPHWEGEMLSVHPLGALLPRLSQRAELI